MRFRDLLLFWLTFFFLAQQTHTADAAPPHRSPPQTTQYLRSLQTLLRDQHNKPSAKPKRSVNRTQRRTHTQIARQALWLRSKRRAWAFPTQDQNLIQQITPTYTGLRLRLFEVVMQREYWSRRMIGEMWLLSHPSPPRLLGLQAQQRQRLRYLWNIAKNQKKLPHIGPYNMHHVHILRKLLEQNGIEVILHHFLPRRKGKLIEQRNTKSL